MTASATASPRRPTLTVVAILRDEATYLDEWLAWHRSLGVGEFLLYDNASRDGTSERLRGLVAAGLVRAFPWPDPPGHSPQSLAYYHALRTARPRGQWTAFIDLDEYLFPAAHDDLPTALAAVPIEAGGLRLNWRVFGAGGAERRLPGLVIERFTRALPADRPHSRQVKIVARTDCLEHARIHSALLHRGVWFDGSGEAFRHSGIGSHALSHRADLLRVNHYMSYSREEFLKRRQRGRAGVPTDKRWKVPTREVLERRWQEINEAEEPDRSALRLVPAVRAELEEIAQKVDRAGHLRRLKSAIRWRSLALLAPRWQRGIVRRIAPLDAACAEAEERLREASGRPSPHIDGEPRRKRAGERRQDDPDSAC